MSGRTWLRVGAPIAIAALVAIGIAASGHFVGEAREEPSPIPAPTPTDAGAPAPEDAGVVDAAWRYDSQGELARPPASEDYVCGQPQLEIEQTEGCAAGRPYPACRWRLPDPPGELYEIWRNTTDDHRWARPGLVSLVLTAAAEYQRRWPGEHLTVGDLDAPGPRHQTHDRGVDVDLYLLEAMIARNEGGRRYPDNYAHRSRREVRALRARVMDLAKILATCADGRIRIYYNDPDLIHPFREWYRERGLETPFSHAMRMHNPLHRFHFHLSVPDDLAPLPPR
ncbi:MAG: hypothetical protein EVA89_19420 [Sandaracinaceae bacterium]|nr:MAG: hypothetical protein EVA89_19420 [Sandaracinaceae bacterium]